LFCDIQWTSPFSSVILKRAQPSVDSALCSMWRHSITKSTHFTKKMGHSLDFMLKSRLRKFQSIPSVQNGEKWFLLSLYLHLMFLRKWRFNKIVGKPVQWNRNWPPSTIWIIN